MILHQITCSLPSALAEQLSTYLEETALSVSWSESNAEICQVQIICDPKLVPLVQENIEGFYRAHALPEYPIASSPLPQENWLEAVHKNFPPLTIGKFFVYGSHTKEHAPTSLIPLQVDAATAFGSGQHESTEGCLQALSFLSEHTTFTSLLDMGCGSGILALAMASLWKASVLACDNDPEAVRVTRENALINKSQHLITAEVSEGFQNVKGKTFDLITANILATPLCEMAEDAAHALSQDGVIVLSGLLNRQAEDVITAYKRQGLTLTTTFPIGEWTTLVMRKKKNG